MTIGSSPTEGKGAGFVGRLGRYTRELMHGMPTMLDMSCMQDTKISLHPIHFNSSSKPAVRL
jgi:hypothetical protein